MNRPASLRLIHRMPAPALFLLAAFSLFLTGPCVCDAVGAFSIRESKVRKTFRNFISGTPKETRSGAKHRTSAVIKIPRD
jgi:hypothetical protein